jgi:transposase
LTLLLLYASCKGVVSSRRIERACYEDLAFRVLTANQQPDHSRISKFVRRNLEALSNPSGRWQSHPRCQEESPQRGRLRLH